MGLFGQRQRRKPPVKPRARRQTPTRGRPQRRPTESGSVVEAGRVSSLGNDREVSIRRTTTAEAEQEKQDMFKADPFEGMPNIDGLRELAELYVGDGADFEGWNEMPSALRSLLSHIARNLPGCPIDLVEEIVVQFREGNTNATKLQEILQLMETDERFKNLPKDAKYSLLLALFGERVVRILKRFNNPQFVGQNDDGGLVVGAQVDVEVYSDVSQMILDEARDLDPGRGLTSTTFGTGYNTMVNRAKVLLPQDTLWQNRFLPTNINY